MSHRSVFVTLARFLPLLGFGTPKGISPLNMGSPGAWMASLTHFFKCPLLDKKVYLLLNFVVVPCVVPLDLVKLAPPSEIKP